MKRVLKYIRKYTPALVLSLLLAGLTVLLTLYIPILTGNAVDLIIGKGGKGSILTLTERSSDLLLMEKFPEGKKAACLPRVVSRLLFPYRGKGVKTITTDNGSEFACHELITKKSGATVYFADCYCSWQKGAIENANKLVRQYIPKGTDFNTITDHSIKEIQKKINRRPREKLDFRSPKECFFEKWEQQKWAV